MAELKKVLFTDSATASNGREGHVKSKEGTIDLDVLMPIADGHEPGKHTNPEELFAAAYASCFDGAVNAVADAEGIDIDGSETTVEVDFGKQGDGFGLAARIKTNVKGVDEATAQKLVEKAHQVCPYSKATRGNINVEIGIK